MDNKYSILGLETLIATLKENKDAYNRDIIPTLDGSRLRIGKAVTNNLYEYIKSLENKLLIAKSNSYVEL